jgi:hypothetical protein
MGEDRVVWLERLCGRGCREGVRNDCPSGDIEVGEEGGGVGTGGVRRVEEAVVCCELGTADSFPDPEMVV